MNDFDNSKNYKEVNINYIYIYGLHQTLTFKAQRSLSCDIIQNNPVHKTIDGFIDAECFPIS